MGQGLSLLDVYWWLSVNVCPPFSLLPLHTISIAQYYPFNGHYLSPTRRFICSLDHMSHIVHVKTVSPVNQQQHTVPVKRIKKKGTRTRKPTQKSLFIHLKRWDHDATTLYFWGHLALLSCIRHRHIESTDVNWCQTIWYPKLHKHNNRHGCLVRTAVCEKEHWSNHHLSVFS